MTRGGAYDKAGYSECRGDSGDFGGFKEYDPAEELARQDGVPYAQDREEVIRACGRVL